MGALNLCYFLQGIFGLPGDKILDGRSVETWHAASPVDRRHSRTAQCEIQQTESENYTPVKKFSTFKLRDYKKLFHKKELIYKEENTVLGSTY